MRKTKDREQLQTHIFHFTKAEERAIRKAVKKAVEFMANYGKGHKQPMLDRRHYITDYNGWKG